MLKLPIDKYIDQITDAVSLNSQVILTATPGAGKTTRLPTSLLKTVKGKIAVLQPRRMAAISACEFVAEEMGWAVGEQVGYQVRLDSKIGPNTRLIYMTDAILLRRLIDDPELSDFDLIVIDEFHERNLNQDVLLGVIKELQFMGRDLKLLVMSATLDLTQIKNFLDESRVVDVPGQVFPLAVQYSHQPMSLQTDFNFIQRVKNAIFSLELDQAVDDILVFLPGVNEIKRVREQLLEAKIQRDVFDLHGSLNLQEQKNVLKGSLQKRVILATNIAEASVTVSGVNAVIDTGLSRILTTNLNSGFSILTLSGISKFNAKQRAGRAAREKDGKCLRLWTVHEESSHAESMVPEVQRLDLSSTVLLLAHLGVIDPSKFSWLSPPPKILLDRAQLFLKSCGALSEKGSISEVGRRILSYPVEARLGAILNWAERNELVSDFFLDLAIKTVALLQDKDIFNTEDIVHSGSESDLMDRINTLDEYDSKNSNGNKEVLFYNLRAVHETIGQLRKNLNQNSFLKNTKQVMSSNHELSVLLLHTQSDRLCRRRGSSGRGVMVGGRGVKLSAGSQVLKSEFFFALQGRDIAGQSESFINLAHGVSKQEVLDELKDQIKIHEEIFFDYEKNNFYQKKLRKFRDLELEEPVFTKVSVDDLGDKFLDLLCLRWDEIVNLSKELKDWMARWTYYISLDMCSSEEELSDLKIRKALEMASVGINNFEDILKQNLIYFLEMQIDSKVLDSFKSLIPDKFHAPSGGIHKIHYGINEAPYVEIRLQEVFGLKKTPLIGLKKTPLILKLLAPNFRPVQVTSDIEGFWQRSYIEVRKELRGRYPKHSWPEDPLNAIPIQKGKRKT